MESIEQPKKLAWKLTQPARAAYVEYVFNGKVYRIYLDQMTYPQKHYFGLV